MFHCEMIRCLEISAKSVALSFTPSFQHCIPFVSYCENGPQWPFLRPEDMLRVYIISSIKHFGYAGSQNCIPLPQEQKISPINSQVPIHWSNHTESRLQTRNPTLLHIDIINPSPNQSQLITATRVLKGGQMSFEISCPRYASNENMASFHIRIRTGVS